jgi:hypothetical protein
MGMETPDGLGSIFDRDFCRKKDDSVVLVAIHSKLSLARERQIAGLRVVEHSLDVFSGMVVERNRGSEDVILGVRLEFEERQSLQLDFGPYFLPGVLRKTEVRLVVGVGWGQENQVNGVDSGHYNKIRRPECSKHVPLALTIGQREGKGTSLG